MKYLQLPVKPGRRVIPAAQFRCPYFPFAPLRRRPAGAINSMRRNTALLLMGVILVLQSTPAGAHGVEGEITMQSGYLVSAAYDDGEPVSYADVEVKAPGSDIAFQSGNLDRNGKFMFYPDTPGTWQVEVKDGMGHRVALDLAVTPNQPADKTDAAPLARKGPTAGKLQNAVTGLAILFGLFGGLYGWKGRRTA